MDTNGAAPVVPKLSEEVGIEVHPNGTVTFQGRRPLAIHKDTVTVPFAVLEAVVGQALCMRAQAQMGGHLAVNINAAAPGQTGG